MNKSFCHKAWIHQKVDPSGKLYLCCVANNPHSHVSELNDNWNSPDMISVREKMAAGERIDNCSYCYEKEDNGEKSPRIKSNEIFDDEEAINRFLDKSVQAGHIADPIESLDVRFGNLCNLRCKMCSPKSSSMILKDYQKLSEIDHDAYKSNIGMSLTVANGWEQDQEAWQQLIQAIPHISDIAFTGGEPSLIESNIMFLETCVELGFASNIDVKFTTNMTNINHDLISALKAFKSVKLEMSIDGIDRVQEYIRYPSNWDKISKNVRKVFDLDGSFMINQVLTVQALNVLQLPDIFDVMIDMHKQASCRHPFRIFLNMLDNPKVMNVRNLPPEVKQIARQKLTTWMNKTPNWEHWIYPASMNNTLLRLDAEPNSSTDRLIAYTKFQDKTRKTTLEQCIPELYQMLTK